jgi:hypothetical protein
MKCNIWRAISVGVAGISTSIWSRAYSQKPRSTFELILSKNHFPFLNFAKIRTDHSTAQYPKCAFRQSYVFINVRSVYMSWKCDCSRHHKNFLTSPSRPYVRDCLDALQLPLLDCSAPLHYGQTTQLSSDTWEKELNWTLFLHFCHWRWKNIHFYSGLHIYCPNKRQNNKSFLFKINIIQKIKCKFVRTWSVIYVQTASTSLTF